MPWYAVYTRSRHEDKVSHALMSKSYAVFLPKIHIWSKRKDRRKKIWVPMFPGYLFVCLNHPDNETRLDILKTFGVVKILGNPKGGEPIPIPDHHIETINRLIRSTVEIKHFQYPRVGERALIIDGPFAGIEGIVTTSDLEHEVFVITFELLHRAVAIKLEGFQIAKV